MIEYNYTTRWILPDSPQEAADVDPSALFRDFSNAIDREIASAFGIPKGYLDGNTSTAQEVAISGEELMRNIKQMMRNLDDAGTAMLRTELIESVYATEQGPRIRTYPRRRAKSDRHWRRMDKKWMKRYGFHPPIPTSYQFESAEFGRSKLMVVVHPILLDQWRRQGLLTERFA